MNKLFVIQLIISFLVGGGIIALLSFIAEKADNRIAGIILTFPTTIALGFFFLGWTLSPNAVANIVPATLIPLGLCVLFAPVYAYIANYLTKIIKSKIWQIIVTFFISVGLWFALAIPVVIFEINDLTIGVVGYLILVLIAHLLLKRKNYEKPITLTYSLTQKIGRATFVGFIVFFVVLLGKLLNPFWGGMLTMFPAAISSLSVILHWYYDPKSLFPAMQKIALGSLSLFAYAITTMFVFPKFGFIVGTFFAYTVSLIVTLLLMKVQPKPKVVLCPLNIKLKNSFYIVRHGKALNNELGIESCKMDTQKAYGLTPEGKEVVDKESQKYTDFDIIFSSPFRRTQETALIFAKTSNCKIILDERLVDVNLGDLDLKPYEVSSAYTQKHPDNDYVYPNGESFSQALNRLVDFIKDINDKNENKKILIVSHGFPCETLLDWFAGKPLKNWDKGIEKGKVFALKHQTTTYQL